MSMNMKIEAQGTRGRSFFGKGIHALLLGSATAAASFAPTIAFAEDCTRYFNGVWNGFPGDTYGAGHNFYIKGSRVTARGASAYTSYAAAPSYRSDMTLAQKARLDFFYAGMNAGRTVLEGAFKDVFPSRADGAIDATTFRIHRNGRVELVLNAWGNVASDLTNVQCFPGHGSSGFVLQGQSRTSSHGVNMWTFFIAPQWLI
ncbi:MAG: hypothetical protein IOD12_08750 [Silvanigrellales bacterium]|jgi:hypothetical protein|nr:hypothetical protein [Silvanigrellales bacterium]